VLHSLDGWQPGAPADVIYSNAALHWLPDHRQLLPSLVATLAPGGVLAIQMPRNFSAPSHTLIDATARAGDWRNKLEPLLGAAPVAEPQFYYSLLAPLARTLDIWESEYLQVLTGADPVKEWTKGTWLMPFLDRLEPAERIAFEADYTRRLRAAYPPLGGRQHAVSVPAIIHRAASLVAALAHCGAPLPDRAPCSRVCEHRDRRCTRQLVVMSTLRVSGRKISPITRLKAATAIGYQRPE